MDKWPWLKKTMSVHTNFSWILKNTQRRILIGAKALQLQIFRIKICITFFSFCTKFCKSYERIPKMAPDIKLLPLWMKAKLDFLKQRVKSKALFWELITFIKCQKFLSKRFCLAELSVYLPLEQCQVAKAAAPVKLVTLRSLKGQDPRLRAKHCDKF